MFESFPRFLEGVEKLFLKHAVDNVNFFSEIKMW